jgi:hemoglobin/transferrin/lactoferrin receptor protein
MKGSRGIRNRAAALALVLATGGWVGTSAADDAHPANPLPAVAAPDSAARPLGMQDTVTVLKPIVVEGQRSTMPDRSSATTVRMDRGRVNRFLPSTAADVLVAAPGVDVISTGPWASRVSMRGLSGERVLVMVDGVRLQSGRGHGAQTSLVSVDKLEGVDIQPGSSSAQYGSDALGGMVGLNTHRSLIAERARTTMAISTRASAPGDQVDESARLRYVGPHVGAELFGSLSKLGSLTTPDGTVPNSGYHDQEVTGRLAARLGSGVFDYEHTTHKGYDIGLPAFTSSAGAMAMYPLQSRDADRFELSVPNAGRRPALGVLAVQQRFRTHYDETNVDSQFVRNRYVAQRTVLAQDRITTWSRSVQPTVAFGAARLFGEWRQENTSGPRATNTTVRSAAGAVTSSIDEASESVPPARRDVWAGGASASVTRMKFRLESSLRYDWLHSQADSTIYSFTPVLDVTDEHPSGEVGLSRPVGEWTPYARLSTGFRAPNLEERYFNSSVHGGMRVFGNPELLAERSATTELGVRSGEALGGHLRSLRVSAYRSEVHDMITLKYLGQLYLVPRFQYTNIKRARLEGLEAEADMRMGRVQALLAAGFPSGTDIETGKPIDDVGAARATLDLRTAAPRFIPMGLLTVRARWTDATVGDADVMSRPSFWTFAAEASGSWSNVRLTLAVKNLTNERYREPLSFLDEPGRTVSLAARWEGALGLPGSHNRSK